MRDPLHKICKGSTSCFLKKKFTWRIYVGYCDTDLNTAHGCDCVRWNTCVYAKSLEGKLQYPYFNWNGEKRNLNAKWADNDWDEHNRFLFVRNSISFLVRVSRGFLCLSDYLIVPTAEHLSNLDEFVGKRNILPCLHDVRCVCNTKENLYSIE